MLLGGVVKFADFVHRVYIGVKENELVDMANALTFKLILSVFPTIIFLMSCVSYFNLDISSYIRVLSLNVPESVGDIISVFISEVFDTKKVSLLSSSLLVTLFSASSGLYTLMKGLNRAYGSEERRGYITQRFISLLLMLIMAALIVISLYVCIFSDKINELLFGISAENSVYAVNLRSYIITAALIFVMIILMYMLALVDRLSVKELIPGTLFTMIGWLVLSKGFNIYINNFSKYSTVYGSLGAIFIFALWLNLLSYALLIGGEINAVLYYKK